jgi:hypothetical protein
MKKNPDESITRKAHGVNGLQYPNRAADFLPPGGEKRIFAGRAGARVISLPLSLRLEFAVGRAILALCWENDLAGRGFCGGDGTSAAAWR